ncbi:MAG: carboxypeptidase-like regulatory domain-containing protein, partial [Flammeovirgaceae bacterium]
MKKLFVLFITLFVSYQLVGQVTIKGVIRDKESKEAIPHATVTIKNTYDGTISNIEGNFSIKVDMEDSVTLVFSYVGYHSQEIKLNYTNAVQPMEIHLQLDASVLKFINPDPFEKYRAEAKRKVLLENIPSVSPVKNRNT